MTDNNKKYDYGYKHIAIKSDTYKKLSSYGSLSDTFDTLINRMLDDNARLKTQLEALQENIQSVELKDGHVEIKINDLAIQGLKKEVNNTMSYFNPNGINH